MKILMPFVWLIAIASPALGQSLGLEASQSEQVVVGEARAIGQDGALEIFELNVAETLQGEARSRLVVVVNTRLSVHTDLPTGTRVLVHLNPAPASKSMDGVEARFGQPWILRPAPLGTIEVDGDEGAEMLELARQMASVRSSGASTADSARAWRSIFRQHIDTSSPRVLSSLARDIQSQPGALQELEAGDRNRVVDRILLAETALLPHLFQLAASLELKAAAAPILERTLADDSGRLSVFAAGALQEIGAGSFEQVLTRLRRSEDPAETLKLAELAVGMNVTRALPVVRERLDTMQGTAAVELLQVLRRVPTRITRGLLSEVAEDHDDELVRTAARTLVGR
ncbi:MAG: hypothetical protein RL885_00710 [Planctomycetota bacterium]